MPGVLSVAGLAWHPRRPGSSAVDLMPWAAAGAPSVPQPASLLTGHTSQHPAISKGAGDVLSIQFMPAPVYVDD